MREENKIFTPEELKEVREGLRRRGKRVVQCHGCFDIVHPGHIRYLQFARAQGDALMVSVSADEVVGKGVDRPYISEDLRLENLAALECVDYVCLDRNTWAGPILELLQPDVYVKGKEYESGADPRFARERDLVESYGGKVILSSGEVVYSSTFILSQFRERFLLEDEKVASFCARQGITRAGLDETLKLFLRRKVLFVGDPILDCYVHCDASKIASESPILDVVPIEESWYLGAAAMMARLVVRLGGEATLLTLLAPGPEGDRFRGAVEASGVRLVEVTTDERPVFVKRRYLVEEAMVFKVSAGRYAPPSTVATRELAAALDDLAAGHDGLVVCDFGYGLFGDVLIEDLGETSGWRGKPYFVDVSGSANLLKFRRPRLAAPTEEELRFAFADQESGLSNLASRYYAKTGAEQLVLTLGKRGAVLFGAPEEGEKRLRTDFLPALASHPIDTVGAGDVFTTVLVLADLCGAPAPLGLYLASCASALQVSQLGNEPPDGAELQRFLDGRRELL